MPAVDRFIVLKTWHLRVWLACAVFAGHLVEKELSDEWRAAALRVDLRSSRSALKEAEGRESDPMKDFSQPPLCP